MLPPGRLLSVWEEDLGQSGVGELRHSLKHSAITRVPSVFFGGGTPSLARPQMVEKVLQCLQQEGHLVEGAEVTMEVNPTSMETQALRDFKEAGINRVSIGIQSLDGAALRLLRRDHCVKEAKTCVEAARQLFPNRVSTDLMFGLPGACVDKCVS
ncbi:Radical S-adenosyl methionine domain-containing protein 1, mitochondrial [Chionoecetes opilio]|uniref:Radical S-adenosyl methionine domain-containing protein 1, mitochondrial n=1 Tax=Chionoecetes opilio TaxID=41210 RepID=A0A8J4YFH4_CHIOP|nr:Radical S-adenosyl methionine domain-containing protein 1, mitochondrial [Chionoecetes opilio]